MNELQWSLIFAGALLLWIPGLRCASLIPLGAGYVLGCLNGQMELWAVIPILLLDGIGYLISSKENRTREIVIHLVFILLAAALFAHWLPGFHNPLVVGPERLAPDAVPFSMYLNLDKPLVGFWLILVWPHLQMSLPPRAYLKAGAIACAITLLACLMAGLLLRVGTWAPKWPEWAWLWAINNLLLVAPAEEALFRGYVQGGLERLLARMRHGEWIALGVAAGLFGFAHSAGGWQLMVLAAIAGLGYGMAYRHGGLQAAILAHFGVNLVHFGLFTYPMFAR